MSMPSYPIDPKRTRLKATPTKFELEDGCLPDFAEPGSFEVRTGFVMLAEAVDADPTNAALWGQYRAAEVALRGLGISADDDALTKFLAGLAGDSDPAVTKSKDAR